MSLLYLGRPTINLIIIPELAAKLEIAMILIDGPKQRVQKRLFCTCEIIFSTYINCRKRTENRATIVPLLS